MANHSTRNKVSLHERLKRRGPKKLLALDGGGIRGVLSLEILRKLENVLRAASGNADYRLADYFDYISGHEHGRDNRRRSCDRDVCRGDPKIL